MSAIDDIRLQLLWTRLLATVEEQARTLMRTAFSTTVREAGDLSAGVFDTHGRMLAQAVTGTPGHVNAMAASVPEFLRRYPLRQLAPGDVLVTNDPWHGTGHLNDFTVVTPVFRDQVPVALFAATSHIADVGGLGFGPDGRDVFEEGLNIPIGHLFRRGEPDRTLFDIVAANVRDPRAAIGDLHSLTACNAHGSEQLLAMMSEFSLDTLAPLAELILERSRSAMRGAIAALPRGSYRYAMRIDGYDSPLDLRCRVDIEEQRITVDFADSSPACAHGINVPLTYTQAYAAFGVRCVVGNEVPNNAGSLSAVRVLAPPGSILNAPRPCAVSARHAIGQLLPDVVLGALGGALDGVVPAEGAACLFGPVFRGPRSDTADSFVINPFFTGGCGARPGRDGMDCTAFPSGVRSTPVEINETSAPLVIWSKAFRPDSGGDGRWRGGHGQRIEFAHRDGAAFTVANMFDRARHPARGRDGGGDGAPARVSLDDGTVLPSMGRSTVPAGRRLILETAGGGGLGEPSERDPAARARDARDGLHRRKP